MQNTIRGIMRAPYLFDFIIMTYVHNNFAFAKQSAATVLPVSYSTDGYHILFSLHCDANTTVTVKVLGSSQEEAPDFSAAASADNDWGYVAYRDLASADLVAGATGTTVSNTTIHKLFEVESNVLTHVAFELTTVSGDGVVIKGVIKGE